ncbi:MAG: restriction endonuclease [Ignavibacteria bacterium]|nr:restriction endonuclease [Ignavibacteria bacterium]
MRRSNLSFVLITVLTIYYWEYVKYILMAITIIIALRLLSKIHKIIRHLFINIKFTNIDRMDGLDFEKYILNILNKQGYSNVKLTERFDYGVDIIAHKDGIKWGIQAKKYSGLVKADAVRQVVTGLAIYNCDQAMVITNSVFSNFAVRLAQSNQCVLIDRNQLAKMGTILTK